MSQITSNQKLQKRDVRIHTRPMTDEEYQYVLRMFAFYFENQVPASLSSRESDQTISV